MSHFSHNVTLFTSCHTCHIMSHVSHNVTRFNTNQTSATARLPAAAAACDVAARAHVTRQGGGEDAGHTLGERVRNASVTIVHGGNVWQKHRGRGGSCLPCLAAADLPWQAQYLATPRLQLNLGYKTHTHTLTIIHLLERSPCLGHKHAAAVSAAVLTGKGFDGVTCDFVG
jgi:hypothetical protein